METSDALVDEYFSNMNYRLAEKEGESCKNCSRCHKCAFGVCECISFPFPIIRVEEDCVCNYFSDKNRRLSFLDMDTEKAEGDSK